MKKFMAIAIALFASFILVACNVDEKSKENQETVEITQTVTMGGVNPKGTNGWQDGTEQEVTQTFKVNPESVAVFNFDVIDMLFTVGIEKTSIEYIAYPFSNIPTFLTEDLKDRKDTNAGTLFIPDLTVLTVFSPDLIIIGGRSAGAYSKLKEEFPNADILDVSTTYGEYIEGLERNATNLGKIFPDIKAELNTEVQKIKTNIQDIHDVAINYEALFIMVNGEAISFYGPNGRFAVLYDEFGFKPADTKSGEGGSHGDVKSYEYVASVNPQIIFLLDRAATIGESTAITTVLNNEMIKGTVAGKQEDIYVLNGAAWYIAAGGFRATNLMIQDLQQFLDKKAN